MQVYGDAYRLVEVAPHAEPVAPFVIKNECGSYITVKPGSTFQVRCSSLLCFMIVNTFN